MATILPFVRPAQVANPLGFPPPVAPFDAAAWLAAWSDHGGIAMLVGDRLWVSRLTAIDRSAATALDTLRGHLHRPGAPDALAGLLRANAGGLR
jgi:hypothetical protein